MDTQSELNTVLISLIYVNNLLDLYKFLETHRLDPTEARDSKGASALHISTLNNSPSLVKFLVRYIQERYRDPEKVISWLNVQNNEGSTCFLYAIYRGNLPLVKYFSKLGADTQIRTNLGLGPMHIAAQSDKARILAYLNTLGFDYESRDYKGSTPLHWAAYLGCEVSSEILLSWSVDIECEDSFGQTPLQLAVVAGNPKIVRNLLVKGASPDVSDICGRTPLDIAKENEYYYIEILLKQPSLLSKCGIRPPQRPIRQRRMLLYLYMILLVLGLASHVYIHPVRSHYSFYVLAALEMLAFILVSSVSPGYVPIKGLSLYEITKQKDINVCAECKVERPPRSKHCQNCRRCILKFDHHCPWINNCLGARNLGLFYIYLLLTESMLIYSVVLNLWFVIENLEKEIYVKLSLALTWGLITAGFVYPLLLLLKVQSQNFVMNMTTNERFSRRVNESTIHEQPSFSLLYNCLEMCFNLKLYGVDSRPPSSRHSENEMRYSWIVDVSSKSLTEALIDDASPGAI